MSDYSASGRIKCSGDPKCLARGKGDFRNIGPTRGSPSAIIPPRSCVKPCAAPRRIEFVVGSR